MGREGKRKRKDMEKKKEGKRERKRKRKRYGKKERKKEMKVSVENISRSKGFYSFSPLCGKKKGSHIEIGIFRWAPGVEGEREITFELARRKISTCKSSRETHWQISCTFQGKKVL